MIYQAGHPYIFTLCITGVYKNSIVVYELLVEQLDLLFPSWALQGWTLEAR